MTDQPTDRIGTELPFENERDRVWDMTLAAGESSDLHRHDHDDLYVYVTPDNDLRIDVPDSDPMFARAGDGAVAYWEVGPAGPPPHYTHRATNQGPQTHRQILVELLGPSAGTEPRGPIGNGR